MDLKIKNILFEKENYIYYEYSRSLHQNYIHGIDNMYFAKKIRFIENYLFGGVFSIFTIKKIMNMQDIA